MRTATMKPEVWQPARIIDPTFEPMTHRGRIVWVKGPPNFHQAKNTELSEDGLHIQPPTAESQDMEGKAYVCSLRLNGMPLLLESSLVELLDPLTYAFDLGIKAVPWEDLDSAP